MSAVHELFSLEMSSVEIVMRWFEYLLIVVIVYLLSFIPTAEGAEVLPSTDPPSASTPCVLTKEASAGGIHVEKNDDGTCVMRWNGVQSEPYTQVWVIDTRNGEPVFLGWRKNFEYMGVGAWKKKLRPHFISAPTAPTKEPYKGTNPY